MTNMMMNGVVAINGGVGVMEIRQPLPQTVESVAQPVENLTVNAHKLIPPAKLPPVDTAPKGQEMPHPRKKPVKRPRKQDIPPVVEEQPQEPTEDAPAEETSAADEAKEELSDFPVDPADDLPFDVDTGQKAEPEQPAVNISKDEITAVIVAKIKQKRSNNEKIGQLLKTYGVGQLSELPAAKYEAFLADISQL